MKDLKAIRGTYYIRRLIEEGEHVNQDFKFAISDARKIARSLSAFANNSGGRLLVGVKDNGVIAGIRNEEDIYVVEQAAELYCRPTPEVTFTTFAVEGGAIVLRVEVAPCADRPVQASEPDGQWRAYYRVADENIAAHPLMVRGWRRRQSPEPLSLSLTGEHRILLQALDERGHLDADDFPPLAHLSRQRANEIIVDLYALDVIDFVHLGGRFVIVARTPAE